MTSPASLILKPGREKSLRRRHPWIFSGAIQRLDGQPAPGATVEIHAAGGEWLARAAYSPQSQITARVWTFDPDEALGPAFFERRLAAAFERRAGLTRWPGYAAGLPDALRLVNAESDGLPGLVVDRYADYQVAQFLSTGAEFWKAEIVSALARLRPAAGIYERSDVDVRGREGLAPVSGVLAGQEPPDLVEVNEFGLRFWVDVRLGHKTGFYLDQRDNRRLAGTLAAGRQVLNAFAYSGGFGLSALRGGAARVTNVESSALALELGRRNAALNDLPADQIEDIEGDVFQVLRRFRDAGRQFDLIVLDPPKFADSQGQVERAARGYKDINLLAFKLLRPGGNLLTFSCSGAISPELFQSIVAGAALDSGRPAQFIQHLGPAPDHPVGLNFPEGEYLKGLVCTV